MRALAALALALSLLPGPAALAAQHEPGQDPSHEEGARHPTIDTVVVRTGQLFSEEALERHAILRLFESLHTTTRPWVVRQEVLLRAGDPYDAALAEETERNLRARGLFREVHVDTARVDGSLAAIVHTQDAWSILPVLEVRIASDGTLTGTFGATETNLAGTGNIVRVWYVREVDRDGLVLGAGLPRIGRPGLGVGGSFQHLSDRTAGSWGAGRPFRSLSDRWSVVAGGGAFDGRVLRFRNEGPVRQDTVQWRRRAFVQRLDLAAAPVASPRGYARVGASAEVRREEYLLRPDGFFAPDPPPTPPTDSVFGLVGAWAEVRRADYHAVRLLNGFAEEDQDLSRVAFAAVKLAPGAWGYGRTGVGLRGMLGAGARAGPLLVKGWVDAHGLFDGAGLDSGRVAARTTAALKPAARHALFLSLAGGVQKRPAPGTEIELGFQVPPRLWPAHAFAGTRSAALTLEHRWFAWQGVRDLVGLGLAAFLDYGGAWYADQDARLGGNAGISLLVGWPLRASPILTELSVGARFGGGLSESEESPWAVSLGTGLRF